MSEERQGQLSRIVINGFKSINNCDLELKNINVLIGANGAGKSNFISVFTLLQNILAKSLQIYAYKKGSSSLFHNGIKITDNILMEFYLGAADSFCFELGISDNNRLFIYEEPSPINESRRIRDEWYGDENLLTKNQWRVYHFQDTGTTSKIKWEHNLSNSMVFQWDGSNLAAFLYRLREHYPAEYNKIIRIVQRIAPYFEDFILKPEGEDNDRIFLRWKEKGCEEIFNPSQLSDGTLRFICLATLLLQPKKLQPETIIIDEPELGLHPYAITIFAELVKKAAVKKQIILATQSVELLDHFEAEDVIVVDRSDKGSEFKRLDTEQLGTWLEDYTLGELWNKNVFGGRISR